MEIKAQEQWNACAEVVNNLRDSNGIVTIDAPSSEWIEIDSLPKEVCMIEIKGKSRVRIRHFSYDKRRVTVHVHDDAWLDIFGDANVFCYNCSTAFAQGLCYVEAKDQSKVYAFDACSVTAWDESTVEAWCGSTVMAFGNGNVIAHGQSTVHQYHEGRKVKYTEFARIYKYWWEDGRAMCKSYGNIVTGELMNNLHFCGVEVKSTEACLYVVEPGTKNVFWEVGKTYKDENGICALSFGDAMIAYGVLDGIIRPRMLKVSLPIQSIDRNLEWYQQSQEFKTKELTVVEEVKLDESQEYLARIWAKKAGVYGDLLAKKLESNRAFGGDDKDVA